MSPAAIAGVGTEVILRVAREMQSSGMFPAILQCCHSFYWGFCVCEEEDFNAVRLFVNSNSPLRESTVCIYMMIECKYMPCTSNVNIMGQVSRAFSESKPSKLGAGGLFSLYNVKSS